MSELQSSLFNAAKTALPTAIMKNPKGGYSLVGSVPVSLAFKRYLTEADAMSDLSQADVTVYQRAEDTTLLEYVTEYLVEELERQPRSLLNKPWFAEAMTKVAIEAYQGGAR